MGLPVGRRASAWRVRGASAQGDGHRLRGRPCQDAFAAEEISIGPDGGRLHVLCVADGAGSQPRSAEGAHLAVGVAVTALANLLSSRGVPRHATEWRALMTEAFRLTHGHFLATVDVLGGGRKQFATTLTLAVLSEQMLAWAAVGDGFIVVRSGRGADGSLHLVDWEDKPENSAGQTTTGTTFLTSAGALASMRNFAVFDSALTGVLLSTDGMEQPLLKPDADGQPGWVRPGRIRKIFEYYDAEPRDTDRELVDFLLSHDLRKDTRDDKTLLVAVRE